MKTHGISLFVLILALSALACSLPGRTAQPQATPPPPAATPVPSDTPAPVDVSSNAPGVEVSIVPIPTPTPVAAKDFAALNASLAEKIAALNQAQLKFIRDMQALSDDGRPPGLASLRMQTGTELTDENLKDIAGKAMDVAILADQLRELAVRQDNGSQQALQSADTYAAIARTAFSLVIDAQEMRTALQNNLMPGSAAIEAIAAYGAHLWNASVTDGNATGNPFTALAQDAESATALNPSAAAQVQSLIKADNSAIWIAQSAAQTTGTVNVPPALLLVSDLSDPLVMGWLATTTAENLSDGEKAQLIAAANLLSLGATTSSSDPSEPMQVQVPINPIAVSGADQVNAGNLPSFQQGTATAVSKESPGDENAFMQTLGLAGEAAPSDQGKTIVQDKPALVNLTISNVVIDEVRSDPNPGGLDGRIVDYHFSLGWTTTLVAPKLEVVCNRLPQVEITSTSGVRVIFGEEGTYSDRIFVSCRAYRGEFDNVGHISIVVSVGGDILTATPTPTATPTQTPTPTATATGTSTPTATGTQTPTPTATGVQTPTPTTTGTGTPTPTLAATPTPTPTAAQAPFTMNGTFGMSWSGRYYTSGFINLTVDTLSGQVSGSIDGSGTYDGDETCPDGNTAPWTTFRQFSGNLVGTIDLNTGVLSFPQGQRMAGVVSTSGGCSDPMTMDLPAVLDLDGAVDLTNRTARGRIVSTLDYDAGEGDWQAGE